MSANQLWPHGEMELEAYNRRDRDNQCGRNDGWQFRTRRATYQPEPSTGEAELTAVEIVIPRAFSSGALSIAL